MAPKIKTLHVSGSGTMTPGPEVDNPTPKMPLTPPDAKILVHQTGAQPADSAPPPPANTPPPVSPTPPAAAAAAPQTPAHPFRKIYVNKSPQFLDSVTAMEIPGLGVIVKTRYRQAPLNEKGMPINDDGSLVPGPHQTTDAMVWVPGAALQFGKEGEATVVAANCEATEREALVQQAIA